MRIESLNAHEILMNELPTWFKPVFEYIELMEVYGAQLDTAGQNEEQIYNNLFIQTADLQTIIVWEKLFGITVRYGDTLEFRRQRVIQKFIQTVPYTIWDLRDRLTALYGNDYTLNVDPVACTFKIVVTSDRYGAIDLLYDLIWDVVPAHLKVIANQQTTSYAVSDQFIGAFLARTFIQTIVNRTQNVTISGNILTINDSAGYPAIRLTTNIEPVQSGTGVPSPLNVRPISGLNSVTVTVSPTLDAQDGTTYTTALGRTVYGGTLDLISGVLTVDKEIVDLGTLTWAMPSQQPTDGHAFRTTNITRLYGSDAVGVCEQYDFFGNGATASIISNVQNGQFAFQITNNNIWVRDDRYTTAAEFKTAVDGVQFVYPLATPQTFALTPQQVKLLVKNNTLWANTNNLTLEYKAFE